MDAMAHENLKNELRGIIAEIIEKDAKEIADEVPLRELGVDSMQAIEIITDIERRYRIKIDESEFKNVTTLTSVHLFVAGKLDAQA